MGFKYNNTHAPWYELRSCVDDKLAKPDPDCKPEPFNWAAKYVWLDDNLQPNVDYALDAFFASIYNASTNKEIATLQMQKYLETRPPLPYLYQAKDKRRTIKPTTGRFVILRMENLPGNVPLTRWKDGKFVGPHTDGWWLWD